MIDPASREPLRETTATDTITTPELDDALATLASAAQRVQSGKKKRGKGQNPPRAVARRREEEAPAAQQGGEVAADE